MARPRKIKPAVDHLLINEEPKTEWQKALAHLEENYKLYIAGAVFLFLCIIIGVLIRVSAVVSEREKGTLYAEAALTEDAAERFERYRAVIDSLGSWTPEALYRMGETAIAAEYYQEAEDAFNRLISEYPNSNFVPDAVDGLAFLAWNKGNLEEALAGFQRVAQDWPGELVGRRKHYDIGQVLEEMERLDEAIAAYQKQIAVFPESAIARKAQQALDTLQQAHPELFPEEGETTEESGDESAEGEPAADAEATADGGDETAAEADAVTEEVAEVVNGAVAEADAVTEEVADAAEDSVPAAEPDGNADAPADEAGAATEPPAEVETPQSAASADAPEETAEDETPAEEAPEQ